MVCTRGSRGRGSREQQRCLTDISAVSSTKMIDGTWLSVRRNDARAFGLWRHHYSAQKNWKWRAVGDTNILGPGECQVLLSQCGRALFAWQHNTAERFDGQQGVCCTVFRNEGAGLSSDLIREADELAWQRWPDQLRHFTYVDGAKTSRRRSKHAPPGRCFIAAGWRECGRSKEGLVLLERHKE